MLSEEGDLPNEPNGPEVVARTADLFAFPMNYAAALRSGVSRSTGFVAGQDLTAVELDSG
jgi:hypothetical protein